MTYEQIWTATAKRGQIQHAATDRLQHAHDFDLVCVEFSAAAESHKPALTSRSFARATIPQIDDAPEPHSPRSHHPADR